MLALNRASCAALLLALGGNSLTACTSESPAARSDADFQYVKVALSAPNAAALPKCRGASAGKTAFVASPPSLYTCQAGAWLPLPCTTMLSGAVAFASESQTLMACQSGKWTPVDLPAGPAGQPGSLLSVSAEPAGANCSAGGQRVDVGADSNANRKLDPAEVTQTAFICDGLTGDTGAQGDTGAPGSQGDPGAQGERGERGVDGAQGEPGRSGLSSLVRTSSEPPGANCEHGGVRINVGLDTDGNGELAPSEVQSTSYVCNGGATGRVARFDDALCDTAVAPDAEHAIFADAASGDDVLGTGEAHSPVRTTNKAVSLAVALGKTSVYLAEGSYGALTLPANSAVYVEGGWKRDALGTWRRDCHPAARAATVLPSVVAGGLAGGLRSLTVLAENGFSNVAVRVTAGSLKVRDSVLKAGAAQDGAQGAAGGAGPNATTTTSQCSTGAPGTAPSPGKHSTGGTFDASGTFSVGNGSTGSVTPLQVGSAGKVGGSAACNTQRCAVSYTYQTSPSCGSYSCYPRDCQPYDCNPYRCGLFNTCYDTCYETCYSTCYSSCDLPSSCSIGSSLYSVNGTCGNGGGPGGSGGGGGGGGASVALVVSDGASVDLVGCELTAQNGGLGASGGAGGKGGSGASGATASCTDNGCGAFPGCGTVGATKTAPAGGRGGDGATGPTGGDGAGGPSYGIVKLGRATVMLDASSSIAFGKGGSGGPNSVPGAEAAVASL